MSGKLLIGSYLVAALVRFSLMLTHFSEQLASRVEVTTALNSWKIAKEATFWMNENIPIENSNIFHEPPLNYVIYRTLINLLDDWPNILSLIFISFDLLTAHFLFLISHEFKSYYEKFFKLTLKNVDPLMITIFYLFNPLILINCTSRTTSVFDNLFVMGSIYYSFKGDVIKSCALLASATVKALYPMLLIIPLSLQLKKCSNSRLPIILIVFITQVFVLLSLSAYVSGNWKFLENVYGFIVNIPNIRPGIGILWYFFAEMFDQFRQLFVYLVQINIWLLYTGPLTVHHRDEPFFLTTLFLIIIAIFKTYPCYADVGLYLSLIPLWAHLFKFMQQNLFIICAMTLTLLLSPVIWFLWIYTKSANANFYFGLMIGFTTSQIFLLVDLIIAHTRRKFVISNYKEIQESDPKLKIKLVLE